MSQSREWISSRSRSQEAYAGKDPENDIPKAKLKPWASTTTSVPSNKSEQSWKGELRGGGTSLHKDYESGKAAWLNDTAVLVTLKPRTDGRRGEITGSRVDPGRDAQGKLTGINTEYVKDSDLNVVDTYEEMPLRNAIIKWSETGGLRCGILMKSDVDEGTRIQLYQRNSEVIIDLTNTTWAKRSVKVEREGRVTTFKADMHTAKRGKIDDTIIAALKSIDTAVKEKAKADEEERARAGAKSVTMSRQSSTGFRARWGLSRQPSFTGNQTTGGGTAPVDILGKRGESTHGGTPKSGSTSPGSHFKNSSQATANAAKHMQSYVGSPHIGAPSDSRYITPSDAQSSRSSSSPESTNKRQPTSHGSPSKGRGNGSGRGHGRNLSTVSETTTKTSDDR